MPVLQWGMLCVLSLLLSIGFLAVHLPAALLLGPMIAGIIFSMRGITLQLPRSAFLAAQAILGCMIAQNLTGSILTTLAVNWPIVLAILLVTLLSSAIVGWLLVLNTMRVRSGCTAALQPKLMVNNIKGNPLINVILFSLINDKVKSGVWSKTKVTNCLILLIPG